MKKIILMFMVMSTLMLVSGCSSSELGLNKADLVYESVVSPNEQYVDDEKDKVIYDIKVYQNKDHKITVSAKSNAVFFEDQDYIVDYDQPISSSDVTIEWTTLMGSDKPSKEDQLVIGIVKIFEGEQMVSERRINFVKNGIEIIFDKLS